MMKAKKVLALLIAMTLLCGLTACGEGEAVQISEKVTPNTEETPLQFNTEMVFRSIYEGVTAEQLESVQSIIESRLIALDVPTHRAEKNEDEGTITIHLDKNESMPIEDMENTLIQVGNMRFHIGDERDDAGAPTGALVLDSGDIAYAEAACMVEDGQTYYYVDLTLKESGKEAFAKATEQQAAVRGTISIWMDYGDVWAERNSTSRYVLIMSPTVGEPITTGMAAITGFSNFKDAKQVADFINAGPLPFTVDVETHHKD